MHRLADLVVAAKCEREVRHAARDVRRREATAELGSRLDVVQPVAIMVGDAGGDGEDVGVEDDVLGWEVELGGQQFERPGTDLDLSLGGVGLPVFVEGHHDHCCTVITAHFCLRQELVDPFFHRDRVDDRLALHALEPGLDDRELRRIDHHRHARDVGLGGDEVEKRDHCSFGIEQTLVHVDVDDLRTVLDLIVGNVQRFGVVAVGDQPTELRGPGYVGPFADIDERDVVGERERFETRQLQSATPLDRNVWRLARDRIGDRGDVGRRRATATADDVDKSCVRELAEDRRCLIRRLVVAAECVGQAGVGVRTDQGVGDIGQFLDVRPHLRAAERGVEPDRDRIGVAYRLPECSRGLTRERSTGAIGDGAGDHHRRGDTGVGSVTARRRDRGLCVERVEDRLDQEHVDSALHETRDLVPVRLRDIAERHGAVARVLDARGHRQRDVGRSNCTGHPALTTIASLGIVGCSTCQLSGGAVELADQGRVVEAVLALRDGGAGERVGGDDVSAGEQVREVEFDNGLGLRQYEEIVIPGERRCVILEACATQIALGCAQRLELGSTGAVQHEDAIGCCNTQGLGCAHAAATFDARPSCSHTATARSARLRV